MQTEIDNEKPSQEDRSAIMAACFKLGEIIRLHKKGFPIIREMAERMEARRIAREKL